MAVYRKFCTDCGRSLTEIVGAGLEYVCNTCKGSKRYPSVDPSDTLIISETLGDATIDMTKSIFIGNAVKDPTVRSVLFPCKKCGVQLSKVIRIKDQRPVYICIGCNNVESEAGAAQLPPSQEADKKKK